MVCWLAVDLCFLLKQETIGKFKTSNGNRICRIGQEKSLYLGDLLKNNWKKCLACHTVMCNHCLHCNMLEEGILTKGNIFHFGQIHS